MRDISILTDAELVRFKSKIKQLPNNCWEWSSKQSSFSIYRNGNEIKFNAASLAYCLATGHYRIRLRHQCMDSRCINPNHRYDQRDEPITIKPVLLSTPTTRALATPCISWTGRIGKNGYGYAQSRWNTPLAHRQAFYTAYGWMPAGPLDHLCHTLDTACRNNNQCLHRSCVNPEHLEPVTHKQNQRRGRGWAGDRYRQTHCINGHEFTKQNTRVRANGTRQCKQCAHDRYLETRTNR